MFLHSRKPYKREQLLLGSAHIASPVSGKIHSKTELPPYLEDLFEQSVKDLYPEQGSKVKHLLQTFSHIFAKDDADFGRTSITSQILQSLCIS